MKSSSNAQASPEKHSKSGFRLADWNTANRCRCLFLGLFGLVNLGMPVLSEPAVDFNTQIRPILTEYCYKCHGPDEETRKGGFRLDNRSDALKAAKSGAIPIVPGKPETSEVFARVSSTDPDDKMPPEKTGKKLSPAQIELLRRWIGQGAPYALHWAYVKPTRPIPPHVKNQRWPSNDIDRFVLARLEKAGLRPSPEAERHILIRRVFLDLTGLPPSPADVEQFLRDKQPGAYERLVDRLLASPSFGEHWARYWLDMARYADSAGYADDPPRTIWAYRDYVIKAFNRNIHFDRFTLEQIAGDLLDDADEETETATAFHRNTMTNNEGGTDDEEFRNAAVVDRVNTTMSVWMGTTMACAQCHSHKYDPLSQQEYFKLFAILNNTADADRKDEAPVLKLWTKEQKVSRQKLTSEIETLEKSLGAETVKSLEKSLTNATPETKASFEKLSALKKELSGIAANTVPVMRELHGDKRRVTHLQIRGNFKALAEEVQPGVPAVFPPLPSGVPADRLALARWLVSDENPLTSRVLANRLWEQFFGLGLVRTSEDFGSQGELPSHPELLDWLATQLSGNQWDLKAFLKTIVCSSTYRQSSKVTPELLKQDPENVLLARGPRCRVPAEVVRDQALAVSGLLSKKMYGPPVRPPQPATGLTAAFGGSFDWKTSEGEDRYRRAIYTELRRTSPYPSLATFDTGSREVCVLRRPKSNTPLQALVTLNDPVFVEVAQGLGKRMQQAAGSNKEKVEFGFQLCLVRPAQAKELSRLVALHDRARKEFELAPEKARLLIGASDATQSSDTLDLASWTVVANVLLNLDEFIMRP